MMNNLSLIQRILYINKPEIVAIRFIVRLFPPIYCHYIKWLIVEVEKHLLTRSKLANLKRQIQAENHQPSIEELNKLGIKVRDYAYHNPLPPVRTIYRHHQQIQPSVQVPRPLKHQQTETEEIQGLIINHMNQSKTPVEQTEPTHGKLALSRQVACLNLEEWDIDTQI